MSFLSGLFSGSKKVEVASTVYNLAGDEAKRPNYLKTAMLGAVMNPDQTQTLGEQLTTSYLTGPGIQLRNFASWAHSSGYDTLLGIVQTQTALVPTIDTTALAATISHGAGETVDIQTAEIGGADYAYWVDQFMALNYPNLTATDYSSSFDVSTNTVTITFADTTTTSFVLTGFDNSKQYLYVSYYLATGSSSGTLVTGTVTPTSSMPSTAGWTSDSFTSTPETVTLTTTTTTVTTYSDHRPDDNSTSSSSSTGSYTNTVGVWEKTTFNGMNPSTNTTTSTFQQMTQWETGSVTDSTSSSTSTGSAGGGVTTTTTTTVDTQSVTMQASYRIDTRVDTINSFSNLKFIIYAYGSGNPTYDALFGTSTAGSFCMPYIPLRVNSTFISDTFMPDIYTQSVKAYKKATNSKYDDLIAKLATNASIGDINYAYVVFGVSLTVIDNSCRQYIYTYLQRLSQGLSLTDTAYNTWLTNWNAANTANQAYRTWYAAQSNPSSPLYGTTAPATIPYPNRTLYFMRNQSANDTVLDYNILISFSGIIETFGTGVLTPTATPGVPAKSGDCWFEVVSVTTLTGSSQVGGTAGHVFYDNSTNHIRLYWQIGASSWKTLDVYDLVYANYIYPGNPVTYVGATELANASTSANESGFIIPLNEDIYSEISLVSSTQMSTACVWLVCNSYKIVTAPWYTSGFFQVFIVIAAVVLAVTTAGIGDVGLLGSSAALGATLGFTGTTALIIGAVANTLAAIILVQVIQLGANALFGPSIGAIIGAIASILALSVGTALMSGGGLAGAFSQLMRADNLLKLTQAIGNGIAASIQQGTQSILNETKDMLSDYSAKERDISTQYESVFGTANGVTTFNPLSLTDVTSPITAATPKVTVPSELPTSFFDRTLMLGSDIAKLSNGMITNFTDIMLTSSVTSGDLA